MSEAGFLTRDPLALLILDCDGVLIDSEPPSARLIGEECRGAGLAITDTQVMHRFAGMALGAISAELERLDGVVLPADWPQRMHVRLVAMLEREAALIEGALEMLEAAVALGLPVRVASNSSHEEMEVKFRRTGLERMLRGRLHSGHDMARPKPWPELFLSAAAAEGVGPGACLVVEDSDTGLRAAQAAGMACVVLRAGGVLPVLDAEGPWVRRIDHLREVKQILETAMRSGAAS